MGKYEYNLSMQERQAGSDRYKQDGSGFGELDHGLLFRAWSALSIFLLLFLPAALSPAGFFSSLPLAFVLRLTQKSEEDWTGIALNRYCTQWLCLVNAALATYPFFPTVRSGGGA